MATYKSLMKKAERLVRDLEALQNDPCILHCEGRIDSVAWIRIELLKHEANKIRRMTEILAKRNERPVIDYDQVRRMHDRWMTLNTKTI